MIDPNDPNIIGGVRFWNSIHFPIPFLINQYYYESIVRRVRADLGKPVGDMFMVSVDEKPEEKFFAINFYISGDELLPVAFRRTDLFLNGFLTKETKDEKTTYQWFELKEKREQTECTIPGAKLLNITMDYGCLSTKTFLGGRDALTGCVRSLLGVTTERLDKRMYTNVVEDLLMLITVAPEAFRFTGITKFVGSLFNENNTPKAAPSWLLKLVKNWDKLTTLALENKDEEDKKEVKWLTEHVIYVYDLEKGEVQLKTVGDLKSALGLLKNAPVDEENLASGQKGKRLRTTKK